MSKLNVLQMQITPLELGDMFRSKYPRSQAALGRLLGMSPQSVSDAFYGVYEMTASFFFTSLNLIAYPDADSFQIEESHHLVVTNTAIINCLSYLRFCFFYKKNCLTDYKSYESNNIVPITNDFILLLMNNGLSGVDYHYIYKRENIKYSIKIKMNEIDAYCQAFNLTYDEFLFLAKNFNLN